MPATDFEKAGHDLVSVAIVCMIPGTELRALKQMLLHVGAEPFNLDQNYRAEAYYKLKTTSGHTLRIAVVYCDGQTNIESAITTHLVLFRHNPRFVFLCGIGGGLKINKCRLGDVVIDSEVVYRRYTKIDEAGGFLPEAINVPASMGGRSLIVRFASEHPYPDKIQSPLNNGVTFAAHSEEKILSWDFVLDHEPTKQKLLLNLDRQLAVVEMEGAGFLKAVDSHRTNLFERPWRKDYGGADAVIVRGISDPAAEKSQSDAGIVNYREAAARNAAQVTLLMCQQLTEGDFSHP